MEKELHYKDKNIRNINVDGEKWYCAKDICSLLDINNSNQALVTISSDNKKMLKIKTTGGLQNLNTINTVGLKELFIKTRNENNALNLARYLGIELYSIRKTVKEDFYITQICIVFNHEKYIKQYYCEGYKIDLYFPKYRLALECDENNHNCYDKNKEKTREDLIIKKLNCKFIRFNPDDRDFNIFELINSILVYISIH